MAFSLQRVTRSWNPNDDLPAGQEFMMDDAAYWKEWLLRRRYAKMAESRAEAKRRQRRIGLCVVCLTTIVVVAGYASDILHLLH
jgi:hypothetical protein